MKKLLLIVFSVWSCSAFGQHTWSPEYSVADASFNNIRPRIALTGTGTPIVLWGDDVNNIVYTAKWNGAGFDAPVRVHSMNSDAFTSYWVGPEIAASGDTVFIGLKIMPEDQHGVYSVRSIDGGLTYEDTVRIDLSPDSMTRYPTVAIAEGGNPVFAYMKFDANWMDPQYHVATSSDGGLTFNDDVNATAQASGEVCDCCPANLQIQGDRQVLTFRNNEANLREAWSAISDDGGLTYPSAKRIDTSDWVIFACPSTGPDAVLDGDNLTTVFMSAGTGKSKVYVSETDVTSFAIDFQSTLKTTDTVTEQDNYVRIAGDAVAKVVVWQHTEWGNVNVYFATSNSGAAYMVDNIDTVNSSTVGNQQSPDVAGSGNLYHIVWQDNASGEVMYRYVNLDPSSTSIGQNTVQPISVTVKPNPFTESTTLTFDNRGNEYFELSIYDVAGRLQLTQEVNSGSVSISANDLNPGTYIYVLTGFGSKGRGKLMVH